MNRARKTIPIICTLIPKNISALLLSDTVSVIGVKLFSFENVIEKRGGWGELPPTPIFIIGPTGRLRSGVRYTLVMTPEEVITCRPVWLALWRPHRDMRPTVTMHYARYSI